MVVPEALIFPAALSKLIGGSDPTTNDLFVITCVPKAKLKEVRHTERSGHLQCPVI